MKDYVKLIQNQEYWIKKDGTRILIKDMDNDYLKNTINFIFKRADFYKLLYELYFCSLPKPNGDFAFMAYEQELSSLLNEEAEEWIQEQPLYKAMVEEVKNRGIEL